MARLSETVRLRLRDEMKRRALSQRDIGNLLQWSQSKVAHQLNDRVEMKIDDLAAFCFALGLRVTEAVRDHGLEFCAEMTPTELRTLDQIRQLPPKELDAVKTLLDRLTKTRSQDRRASPPAKSSRKPR